MLFEAATDDYLHLIIRTRPWTKQREEALLAAFTEWLYEQATQQHDIAAIDPEVVQQYAIAMNIGEAEHDELLEVLSNVSRWAIKQGWITTNRFLASTLV